jgi:hypothetical protein
MKSLPARPSLESLRKQAKKLARDIAAGDADAIRRVRAHLSRVDTPLTQRSAQLVIAREYGFTGWEDLTAEVSKRLGDPLERVIPQARRAIHDNDLERLKKLLTEYPALLSWKGDENDGGGLLGFATGAYGDAFGPEREGWFTRAAAAELLIDAGAVVAPSVPKGLIDSRAVGLLELFHRKGLLPRTLAFHSALGDVEAVRRALDEGGNDLATVNDAFISACRFEQRAVAALLLDRSITLDPELGRHVDLSVGRPVFIEYFIAKRPAHASEVGLWKAFVMEQVSRAIPEDAPTVFVGGLRREPWLLGDAFVWFQADLLASATLNDRQAFIVALFDLAPAILRRQPPPQSQAIEFAFTYANTQLLPLLTRIWPVPDDLPHTAGMGNLTRVKQWFDASGAPALGDLDDHYPYNDPRARGHLQWDPPTAQQVLDVALAFSVINRHFHVADFLLEHGADINTNWNSHEPASILHHLVFLQNDYEPMQFLIDRGIDMKHQGLPLEQYGTGLGIVRHERSENGGLAGGGGTEAGTRRSVRIQGRPTTAAT